jgi:8-oxo-dGTP pyrophosphatase MutT (NUDIX family)
VSKSIKSVKHYTTGVFIFTNSLPKKVLLVHHKAYDKWMQPGGHQEEWENPIEAAIREVHEETGIDITSYMGMSHPIDENASLIPQPAYLLECKIPKRGKEPEHYHLEQSYVVHMPEQPVHHKDHGTHNAKWLTSEQISELPMFENVRMIVEQEMSQV